MPEQAPLGRGEALAEISASDTPTPGIARAASLVALGNLTSRVLGLLRESLSAGLFGATGLVSAFGVANIIPRQLYDLLIGGMLNSALVPVFSEYVAAKEEKELWRVLSAFLSLAVVVLLLIILVLEALVPRLTWLIAGGFAAEQLAATETLIRVMLPSVLFLSMAGVLTAALYARGQFVAPAIAVAVYNLGIIVAMLLLSDQLGIYSLGVGVLLAALLQLLVQLPALRKADFRFAFRWRHPALRRVLALYSPVVLGLVVSMVQVGIDRRLASGTGDSSIAWMDKATTLVQSAHGLVAVAISTAVLPMLSRRSAAGDLAGYRHTLGQSLRLSLWLIIPICVALWLLAEPLVAVLFQRGQFTSLDTLWTSRALRLYVLGLAFATIDWPLNYASYARQDTTTPALVGVLSVVVYLGAALAMVRPLGMLGLVLADSIKHSAHAVVMLVLTQKRVQGIHGQGLPGALIKILAASLVTGAVIWGVSMAARQLTGGDSLLSKAAVIGSAGVAGGLAYAGLSAAFRMEEGLLLFDAMQSRVIRIARGLGREQSRRGGDNA